MARDLIRPPAPISAAQTLASADHWDQLASAEEQVARWQEEHRLPLGDVTSYYARAVLWCNVAAGIRACVPAEEQL